MIAECGQHGVRCSKQSILAGRRSEFIKARPEHEPALHIASHEAVELECNGEAMRGWAGKLCGRYELGKGGRTGLQSTENRGCLVEYANSARIVHRTILQSRRLRRKCNSIQRQ